MKVNHNSASLAVLAMLGAGLLPAAAFATEPAASAASAQAAENAGAEPASPASYGDIIVTAQRRAERGQDVPIAITAFSAESIQQQNLSTGQDLMGKVPSLTVNANGQATRSTEGYTLRGVPPTYEGASSTVIYLAEVPLPQGFSTNQQGGPGNYVDLESIQVLAGPQGTLFGRNTTGGAVLLVPHKPTNQFEGYLEGTFGNYDHRGIEGVINVPLAEDKLMIRASGTFQDRDGFTKDVLWNTDRDNMHYYAGRVGITFKPTENFENYMMIYGSKSRTHGSGYIHIAYNLPLLPAFGACNAAFPCDIYQQEDQIAAALGPRKTRHGLNSFEETDTWGIINTSDITLNDQLTLRNIISYQRYRMDFAYDADATPLQHLDSGSTPYPDFPVPELCVPYGIVCNGYANEAPAGPRDNLEFFTEELQLQGNMLDGKLNWTVGGFYYDSDPVGKQLNRGVSNCRWYSTGNLVDPDGAGPLRACAYRDRVYGVSNTSKAAYGQFTLDFGAFSPALDSLRLTAGYRQTWDTVEGRAQTLNYTFNPANPSQITNIRCGNTGLNTLDPRDCLYESKLKYSTPTWTIGLDYRPLADLLLYGKVSRGFKAGGFNKNAVRTQFETFGAEKVTAYEAGFKSDWKLGTVPVRWNLAGFLTDYPNYVQAVADTDPLTFAAGSASITAGAQIKGIESELVVRPIPEVELGGSVSYTDAKWKKFQFEVFTGSQLDCSGSTVGVGGVADLTCGNFPHRKWVYNLYASVDLPVPDNWGKINLFANYSHFSSWNTAVTDLAGTERGATYEPYGLLNLSASWRGIGGAPVDATFFMNNATDKLYRVNNTGLWNGFAFQSVLYGEPRMYGVKLRYRFGGEEGF